MVFKDRPTIGVFTKELQDIYFYPILKGIRTECSRQKINLRIFVGNLFDKTDTLDPNLVFYQADKKNVDGIILLSVPVPIFLDKKELSGFIDSFSPLPVVNVGIEIDKVPSIVIENKKGIFDVVSHFITVHGFKHIAHIGGPRENREAALRFEGYKKALAENGIEFDPRLYYEGDFLPHSGINGCRELFEKRKVKMEAIVCANDETAVGVLNYCRQKGYQVPGDVSVSGFDNLLLSNYTSVPLTTVAQPLYRTGVTAVELILNRINNRKVPLLTVLPANLLIRTSCGCTFTEDIDSTRPDESGEKRSLSESEYSQVIGAQKEAASIIYDSALIEDFLNIERLSRYIISNITGIPGTSPEKKPVATCDNVKQIGKLIKSSSLSEDELNSWHDFLTLFYYKLRELSFFSLIREQVHTVFSALIHRIDYAIRQKLVGSRASILENTFNFRRSFSRFNLSFSMADFLKVMTEELTAHNFNYFYISLWTGRAAGYPAYSTMADSLHLAAGFDGKKLIDGYNPDIVYDRKELIPPEYINWEENHSILIYPLVQHEYYFGLLIISFQEEKIGHYNPFWNQICLSLNLIRLLEEAKKKSDALNRLNISLESIVSERTEELLMANRKLREIDRLKTNFFANISHELRTPLTLILGPMEGIYAGDYGKKIDYHNEVFKSVTGNAERLLKLINNLLDFSKIESGKMQINKRKTNIGKLIEYYLSIITSSAQRKGIKIVHEGHSGPIRAWVDRDLLEKALFNLFSNAIKFTRPQGVITIILRSDINTFSIAVKDTGIGIPADKLEAVFDRFTQVEESAAGKYRGTGIGLAFTREIVELHGGTITVDSTHGRGSTFTISLPYGKSPEPASYEEKEEQQVPDIEDRRHLLPDLAADISQDQEEAGTAGQLIVGPEGEDSKKILVIDDNKDMRTFLTSILRKKYSVITGENGEVGLEKAAHHLPDLIISDIMMPVMNGVEFCRRIKSDSQLKHIPLILLTARTDLELKLEGLEEQADDFLPKPFNSRELLVRIRNLLTAREMQVKLARQQETIMTGVAYAGKIQNSILPDPKAFNEVMADYFILWKPRDIVGGDIFWFKNTGDNFLLAVIDCTGHGVPGAFMSMTAYTELDNIVKFVCNDNPARILQELNKSLKRILKQNNTIQSGDNYITDDGLDICLCCCSRKEKKLIYAGARRPLYYIDNDSLIEIKPDNMSIGYRSSGYNMSFTNHEISLRANQIFYLSTDGYEDQIGGPDGFSFGKRRLKELLLKICGESMDMQRHILESELTKYKMGTRQVDDITLLGFSVE